MSLSLDQALTNTIMQLHDDGAHPALIYVDGASFADATAEVGSTLLLSLSSARIPCLTLGSGDDIVHTLSLWRAGHREETGAR